MAAITEIGVVLAFYQWYSAARHWVAGSETVAYGNALRLMRFEAGVGVLNEASVQQWVMSTPWLMPLLGLHYAAFHFAVPVLALVILFRRCPDRYRRYRNVLGWTSGLAVVAFALWPLMPPRLLPGSYGFVDVLVTRVRSPSPDRGFAPALYNGFAAMPSLHVAYALWCVVALWPILESNQGRMAVVGHALVTLIAVVATGNHYYLDALGGVLVLVVGVLLSARVRLPDVMPAPCWAAAGLLGAAAFIWIPKGELALAAEDVLVVIVMAVADANERHPDRRQPCETQARSSPLTPAPYHGSHGCRRS